MKRFISLGMPPKKLDYCFHARVDGGVGEREVGSERKAQQRDALAIDLRLRFDEADCVPEGFHPHGKIALHRLQVGGFSAGAVKIMQQVNSETLGRERAGVALHAGDVAAGAVECDDGGEWTILCLGQVGAQADGLAARLEDEVGLGHGGHRGELPGFARLDSRGRVKFHDMVYILFRHILYTFGVELNPPANAPRPWSVGWRD